MPTWLRKASANKYIFMKFTENSPRLYTMVEEDDTSMSVEALLEFEGDDESIESLFKEAFDNVEEAMRRTDRMQRAGVSPSTPFFGRK